MKQFESAEEALDRFDNGLVFGIDPNVSGIAYYVRRGTELIEAVFERIPDLTSLKTRRTLRRGMLTRKSAKIRKASLCRHLARIGLRRVGREKSRLHPVALRLMALGGKAVTPGEMNLAIRHEWRKRGWEDALWKETRELSKEEEKELKGLQQRLADTEALMKAHSCHYPCELLNILLRDGKSTKGLVWRREMIEAEFRKICWAQKDRYPALLAEMEQILDKTIYETREQARRAGAGQLSITWARFDNRGPGLDIVQPFDAKGRPQHVVRAGGPLHAMAVFCLWLMNFRIQNERTGVCEEIPPDIRKNLLNVFRKERVVHLTDIKKVLPDGYVIPPNQDALTKSAIEKAKRCAYSRPTLKLIIREFLAGRRFDPPAPMLRHWSETRDEAIERILRSQSPATAHCLRYFSRTYDRLVSKYGHPDHIIIEAVRSPLRGEAKKKEIEKNKNLKEEKDLAAEVVQKSGLQATDNMVDRYLLAEEARWHCPYCLSQIGKGDLQKIEIEHIYPEGRGGTNDWDNLTVSCQACNRKKDSQTPFEAFGGTRLWEKIKGNAKKTLPASKLGVFLSESPDQLIESRRALNETASRARAIRSLLLVKRGGLTQDGRDPGGAAWMHGISFTSGSVTASLRNEWDLNGLLHSTHKTASHAEKEARRKKNRGDDRHHIIDAMVIAHTVPVFGPYNGGYTAAYRRTLNGPVSLIREAVLAALPGFKIYEHKVSGWSACHYDQTHLCRKEDNLYGKNRPTNKMSLSDIKNKMFGTSLRIYFALGMKDAIQKVKEQAEQDKAAGKKNLKKGVKGQPELQQLCYRAFQTWFEALPSDLRIKGALQKAFEENPESIPAVVLPKPEDVVQPILRVRVSMAEHDCAVVKRGPGYRERKRYREVVVLRENGHEPPQGVVVKNGFEMIPVPHWRNDPLCQYALEQMKTRAVVRRYRKGDCIAHRSAAFQGIHQWRVQQANATHLVLVPWHVSIEKDQAKKACVKSREYMEALGKEDGQGVKVALPLL